ncbi:MAG: hypothetical protein EBR30_14120 [Cytophagia bacterium]|nr:hypothetical protein [Cytophagia bacterium]
MAYEITAKGKESVKKHPEAYKSLLAKIAKYKPEVVHITEGWRGKPVAKIKIYNIGVVRANITNVVGYTFLKGEANKAANALEKALVDILRVTVSADTTYFE